MKFPNANSVVNYVTTTRRLTSGPLEYRCTIRRNRPARLSQCKVNSKYWDLYFFRAFFAFAISGEIGRWWVTAIFYSFCFSKSNVREEFYSSAELLSRKLIKFFKSFLTALIICQYLSTIELLLLILICILVVFYHLINQNQLIAILLLLCFDKNCVAIRRIQIVLNFNSLFQQYFDSLG